MSVIHPPTPPQNNTPITHPSLLTGRARSGNRRSPNPLECQPGFFKAAASSDKCEPCPANTQGPDSGALFCPCMDGFYRAPNDPPTGPCSGLPSAPRDLLATTTQLSAGKLLLSWSPPEDTGGRTDITYSVDCQRCEGSACQPCGEKIRYEPASMGLTDTKVSVSELDAHLNYTFTVEAHSGVSVFASQATPSAHRPPSTSALTTSLHYTDPPKITTMRLVERTSTTLSLSWDVSPRPRVQLRPIRYELTYRKKDDNLDVTTYIVLKLEKNSVQISDLDPGTAYLFRVQALSSDGSPGGSSVEEQFETSSEGLLTHNTAFVLCLAVEQRATEASEDLIGPTHIRPQHSPYWGCHQKSTPTANQTESRPELVVTTLLRQSAVNCSESPLQGFGEVCRGILKVPGEGRRWRWLSDAEARLRRSKRDFLKRGLHHGQFSHQNIIRLEVVTKCKKAISEPLGCSAYGLSLNPFTGDAAVLASVSEATFRRHCQSAGQAASPTLKPLRPAVKICYT
ncbi:ephrin type-A receptor 2 [Lates japonicus]|uniref:Ephrin type-A receptor 2 n=1 Tax=Lates japonicus TaxID=270547 RepID=A0AAD3QZA2_LATJO|nr:ephrin type-A receptor 2 [Lates japonicus]